MKLLHRARHVVDKARNLTPSAMPFICRIRHRLGRRLDRLAMDPAQGCAPATRPGSFCGGLPGILAFHTPVAVLPLADRAETAAADCARSLASITTPFIIHKRLPDHLLSGWVIPR